MVTASAFRVAAPGWVSVTPLGASPLKDGSGGVAVELLDCDSVDPCKASDFSALVARCSDDHDHGHDHDDHDDLDRDYNYDGLAGRISGSVRMSLGMRKRRTQHARSLPHPSLEASVITGNYEGMVIAG